MNQKISFMDKKLTMPVKLFHRFIKLGARGRVLFL